MTSSQSSSREKVKQRRHYTAFHEVSANAMSLTYVKCTICSPVRRIKKSRFQSCLFASCIVSAFGLMWLNLEYATTTSPSSNPSRLYVNYFTATSKMEARIEQKRTVIKTVANEYARKEILMGAVLTSVSRLDQTVRDVNRTWGPSLCNYKIFVRDSSEVTTAKEDLPIVTLQVGESATAVEELFEVLKFIHANYIELYNWFIVVPDKTYVLGEELKEVLYKLDPRSTVYMGKAGSTDPVEMMKYRMIANEYFCESGPGIVLSNGAIKAIVPYLDECFSLLQEYGKFTLHSPDDVHLYRPDVELGRCFSRRLRVHCSTSQEAQRYFYHDSENESIRAERLWTSIVFQESITLYPIHDATHLQRVHHFFVTRRIIKLKRKLNIDERSVDDVCTSLFGHTKIAVGTYDQPAAKYCSISRLNDHKAIKLQKSLTSDELPQSISLTHSTELTEFSHIGPEFEYYYQSKSINPRMKLSEQLLEELHYIIKNAVTIINRQEAAEYAFKSIENAYLRYVGTRGREYILDLILSQKHDTVQKRIHLLRTYLPNLVVLPDSHKENRNVRINFVVPITHVNKRFDEFIRMYAELSLKTKENVFLVLPVFGKDNVKYVRKAVEAYVRMYPHMEYRIVSSEMQFSLARAKALGMSVLNETELAFICDVDMTVEPAFLSHCRTNAIRGRRVYFPQYFRFYDMNYVYRLSRPPITGGIDIQRKHGHWAAYGVGMLCIYKSDYLAVGGFDTSIDGWGEAVDLYKKIIQNYEVIRVPDPALLCRYHDEQCSAKLSNKQLFSCISSVEESVADNRQLTEYVFYLEEKYHVSKRQLWE